MNSTLTTYRIFVGAFPDGEMAERIQALRVKLDPTTAQITPPHVTMAGTYTRTGKPVPGSESETIQQLSHLKNLVPCFQLQLKGIGVFPRKGKPVIIFSVEQTDGLLQARRVLMESLGQDKHQEFNPHLTLAMRLDEQASRRALITLQKIDWVSKPMSFHIEDLRLMLRSPSDPSWKTIAIFPLASNGIPTGKPA